MAVLSSTNITLPNTCTLHLKVRSGGSPTGTADTNFRHLGYLAKATWSVNDVNEVVINAMPSPGAVKRKFTAGGITIAAELMEADYNNMELLTLALGRNPNDYDGDTTTPIVFGDEVASLEIQAKLVGIPAGADLTDLSSVDNCICVDLKKCNIDFSAFTKEFAPAPENAPSYIPITIKSLSDPDEGFAQALIAVISSVDISATSTDPFADL